MGVIKKNVGFSGRDQEKVVKFPVALKFLKGVTQLCGKFRGVSSGIFKSKVKNIKVFLELVLISLRHLELYFWPCQPQTQNNSNIAKRYLIKSFTDPGRLTIGQYYIMRTCLLYGKSPPSVTCHPQLMTFKHSPHLFAPACPNPINITTMARHHT